MYRLLIFFTFISFSLNAQKFAYVDRITKSYPRYNSIEELANQINKDFTKNENKVRAAYIWLTSNIEYKKKVSITIEPPKRVLFFTPEDKEYQLNKITNNLISEAFTAKKGVCEHYAQSLKKICDLLHIESYLIKGYTRNSFDETENNTAYKNHIWNLARIKDNYIYVDATWGAGTIINNKWVKKFNNYYFDIDKKKIHKTHLFFYSNNSTQEKRKKRKAFFNQPFYSQKFLKSNLEIITPTNGIITTQIGKTFELQIENLKKNTKITYAYNTNLIGISPKISRGKVSTLTIKSPKKNAELFLFLDNQVAITYKVIVKHH